MWEPQNFDQEYDGEVTMRDALARSKNIPTVRLASAVGLAEVAKAAREAGIRSDIDETPAMPLGTVAVSPLELATAYAAFAGLGEVAAAPPPAAHRRRGRDGDLVGARAAPGARHGRRHRLPHHERPAGGDRARDGDGRARERVRGAPPPARRGPRTTPPTPGSSATRPRLVAAVWMGFDEPRPIMGLATGGRLAAPVWGRMMVRAPESLTTTATWAAPATVVQAWIDPQSGRPLTDGCRPYDGEALRELFLKAALPPSICPDQGEVTLADASPAQSDEDEARDGEPWPDDMGSRSHPAPPPEYEEAETWRRAREQAREDAERAYREARKEYERQLKEWRKEEKRRRREREREE